MANLDGAKGFSPLRAPYGCEIPVEEFTAVTGITVYPGQILYLSATGEVDIWTGTATGRTSLLGAAVGYLPSTESDRSILVAHDPAQEYEVQTDDNSVTVVADVVGENFGATNLTSVNATTLRSLAEIDGSDSGVTNNSTSIRPFRALRVSRNQEGSDLSSSYANIVVRINSANHHYTADAGI
jgi:hypothetical protein